MNKRLAAVCLVFLVLPRFSAGVEDQVNPRELFSEPVTVVDQNGAVILTRRAMGHPMVMDWNGDGKNDIILGAHAGMNTTKGEIILMENIGTNEKPQFKWPGIAMPLGGGNAEFDCGCSGGGALELQIMDWDGDGKFDIMADTYWYPKGVLVLQNITTDKAKPEFKEGEQWKRVNAHGKGSGGGDWNNDGILDYLFPVNEFEWNVYAGVKTGNQQKYAEQPSMRASEFKIVGNDKYKNMWFTATPIAWNYSGKHGSGSQITEIAAVCMVPDTNICDINYYWLDRSTKTVTRMATLATNNANRTRLGFGDLNNDGCMDLLYSGGVWSNGDETQIYVLYGKVLNMPGAEERKKKLEETKKEEEAKPVVKAPEPKPEIAAPKGYNVIYLTEGEPIIAKVTGFPNGRIAYETPSGDTGTLNVKKVKRIQR